MLKKALILTTALAIGAAVPAVANAAGTGATKPSVTAGKAQAVLVAGKKSDAAATDDGKKKKKKKKKGS